MSVTVLGIDIAKQKFDVALLLDGKTKHKTCKNSTGRIGSARRMNLSSL